MAKRKFSAKQLANQRRFAAMVRNKFKSKRSASKPMARRRSSRTRTIFRRVRSGGSRARGMLGGLKTTIAPMAAGIGGSMIAKEVAGRAFPAAAPIAGIAGAWLFGGIKGVIGSVLYDAITGQGGILGGIFGSGSASNGGDYL